jgi:hypothetical protein
MILFGVCIMGQTFPRTDNGLLSWSLNFSTRITAAPLPLGLTAGQATVYAATHALFATDLAACDPTVRNKSAVSAKNAARATLKLSAQQLINIINGQPAVTDSQKLALGISPRATPHANPVPSDAPGVDVLSVNAWTVKTKLHDSASSAKRGKPPGVSGASIFSYVGTTPPADIGAWQFEGNTGKTNFDVVFPNTLAPGAKVWITAFWFNGRKQSGPNSAPVSANLPGGSVSMAA